MTFGHSTRAPTMKQKTMCSHCNQETETQTSFRGSSGLEALLWLVSLIPVLLVFIEPLPIYFLWIGFIVSAVGYSLWRRSTKHAVCVACKKPVVDGSDRTNIPAAASLTLGLMLQIPLLSGILAVIFGLVGMKRAKNAAVGGATLAKVGLLLGCLNIVGWMTYSFMLSFAWQQMPLPPPPH